MNIKERIEKQLNYLNYAEKAAACERAKQYDEAYGNWVMAQRFAADANVEWP